MSTRPHASRTAATSASTEPASVTSVATASASSPARAGRRPRPRPPPVDVGERDARALDREHLRDAAADAARAARDDGDLPVQALHQEPSAGRLACIAAIASTSDTLKAM